MKLQQNQQIHKYQLFTKVFLGLMIAYLMFHLFLSERSIPSFISVSAQSEKITAEVAVLKDRKAELLDKVTRLRPETLDPDLVEEYSIHMLGHGGQQGLIIIDEKNS